MASQNTWESVFYNKLPNRAWSTLTFGDLEREERVKKAFKILPTSWNGVELLQKF